MRGARALTAAAVSGLLIIAAASPADAQRWGRSDRVGDGPTGGDISHLKIANRTASVRIVVRFDDLVARETGRDFFVVDTQREDGFDYILYTRWTRDGVRSRLIRAVPFSESDAHRIACPNLDLRWRPSRDRIDVRIPQPCLRRPTPLVRAGFYSVDRQVTDDDWAPGQYATYGPWLDIG